MAGGFEKFIYPFLDKSCITPADQVKRGCQEHRDILAKEVENWNSWRAANPDIKPDLSYANFNGHDLRNVNLSNANVGYAEIIQSDLTAANMEHSDLRHTHLHQSKLNHANMKHAFMGRTILVGADLSQACLRDTVLYKASLNHANLHGADVSHAYAEGIELPEANLKEATVVRSNLYQAGLRAATLVRADLSGTNLDDTDLRGADLREAILKDTRMRNVLLVSANVNRSTLTGSNVFGVSAWGMKGRPKEQLNLIITDIGEPVITVDNLEIAQFIYLLIRNERIRDVIDTVGNKAVLILGRFTEERKAVLNSIREHLRQLDYVPILFDFEKPASRDLTETISILAGLSRFIIADITDAKGIPQELQAIAPNLLSVAVQPIIQASHYEYALFEHIKRFPQVLPVYQYDGNTQLIDALKESVIGPAESRAVELRTGKRE